MSAVVQADTSTPSDLSQWALKVISCIWRQAHQFFASSLEPGGKCCPVIFIKLSSASPLNLTQWFPVHFASPLGASFLHVHESSIGSARQVPGTYWEWTENSLTMFERVGASVLDAATNAQRDAAIIVLHACSVSKGTVLSHSEAIAGLEVPTKATVSIRLRV